MKKECEELGPVISAYVDGELSDDERARVEAHVENCPECRELLGELEKATGAIQEAFAAPEIDLSHVWGAVEKEIVLQPSVWQRVQTFLFRPLVWAPATLTAAVVAAVVFLVKPSPPHAPTTAPAVSQVESVYSQTGQLMVMKTAQSGQPLIWILPKAEKEAS